MATLSQGDTLVPWIFMSDGAHHSNFALDTNVLPVYMTIGNHSSKIRQTPSTHTIIIVALLPIPMKNRNISQKQLDDQWRTNQEVLNKLFWRVPHPLTFEQNPNAESWHYNVLCADSNIRSCTPGLAAWLADYPECSDLHHPERYVCFWCECPKNELGDYVTSDKPHPQQDHNVYRTLSDAISKAANAKHSSRHVHREFNVFGHIPYIVSYLPKPDLIHTMQITMLANIVL
jgi:hypothetical protein